MIPKHFIALSAAFALGLSPIAAAASDGVLDVAAPFEIKGADPSTSGDIFLKMRVAETLVEVDGDGKPVPGLAASWELSDDATIWRFNLRRGVVFHDGSPLTSESVANALNQARSKPGLLDRAPITSIEAGGDDVVVTLSQPFAPLLAFLAEYRSQILAPGTYSAAGDVTEMIATGPFRITSLEPPQRLTVERFPDYWGEKPSIERASYLAVGRGETRALMAESGDADFVFNLDPASRTRLEGGNAVNVLSVAIPRSVLLKINGGHDFLKDIKAREALSLAIDREGIAAAILRYPAGATQLFPPSVGTWHDEALPPLGYDVDKARALLAELGWTAGGDGVLEREGKRFTLTLTTYPDRPELPLIAAVLQEQFREIGIDVTIDSTNSSEIPARHHDNTLELGLMARNFALVPDPIGTMLQDYGPQGGDWGAMNWSNPKFDQALADLARTDSAEAGQPLRDSAVSILQQELPVIPIAWYQQTAAVSKALEGARLDPYERDFGLGVMRWSE